jgi:hypothetical protein
MRVIGYVIAALLAAVCAANAATDELSALYTQVLQRPADSDTSLRYARAAEAAGKLRWAYAAYERVAVNDPSNREAQDGLLRVARRLQPAFTEYLLQAGVSYESKRQDFIWSPGATLFAPNFFAHQVGLKLEYQYIRDNSNNPTASFVDNMVTASVVARF